MALSVVDLYQNVLPRTNCGDCGQPTCLAFAAMVVSEKTPLAACPHMEAEKAAACQTELDAQHAAGKWTKRDLAEDALKWAKERAASMAIADLPDRIGGDYRKDAEGERLQLPYFNGSVIISDQGIQNPDGSPLTRWEQVFLFNHLAQGGHRPPSGNWKGLEAFPNTVSKIKTMRKQVEVPLMAAFSGQLAALDKAAATLGATDISARHSQADRAFLLQPLPRIPVTLLFWDADPEDDFGAQAKLLFDETVTEHLDIESIIFLSERIRQLLCGDDDA